MGNSCGCGDWAKPPAGAANANRDAQYNNDRDGAAEVEAGDAGELLTGKSKQHAPSGAAKNVSGRVQEARKYWRAC